MLWGYDLCKLSQICFHFLTKQKKNISCPPACFLLLDLFQCFKQTIYIMSNMQTAPLSRYFFPSSLWEKKVFVCALPKPPPPPSALPSVLADESAVKLYYRRSYTISGSTIASYTPTISLKRDLSAPISAWSAPLAVCSLIRAADCGVQTPQYPPRALWRRTLWVCSGVCA